MAKYHDSKGNECSLFQAVRREPEWAASRINEGHLAAEQVARLTAATAAKDEQITFLWSLLDDISTAGDMFKPEITSYFKYVNKCCEERSIVANSIDGISLEIKELVD